jgi:hypothetical protein
MDSLCFNGTPDQFEKYSQYEWKRASEIFNAPKLFSDGICPADINQGELGDCYFLAVCSSMAEDPTDVMERFSIKTVNAAGIYLVDMYINGVETPIIVDDWLPTKYGRPAFASSGEDELWVCLLEKAWAKLHGCYMATEGGLPTMASAHLCGVPSYDVEHSEISGDIDGFWTRLSRADKHSFTIMSATHGQGENVDASGIISGHAYSLISIHELETDEGPVRLCKLRNPWGSGEWLGDWSD